MSDALQEIVALFGQPVAGNPMQFMLETAFAQAGLDWRYLTLEVAPEALHDAIRGLRAMGFRGANVTAPHQVAVAPLLDELSPAARLTGAVNCIHIVRDQLHGDRVLGENADGKGFLKALQEIADPAGKRMVILGAGGAAWAIGVELGLAGAAHLTIVNRTADRARPLVELLNQEAKVASEFTPWSGSYAVPAGTDIVINATTIGMGDADAHLPIQLETLTSGMVAADVVISPVETLFLREAHDRGCRTLDGLGMLVQQGAICFRIWTGVEPDAALMRDALEEFLGVL